MSNRKIWKQTLSFLLTLSILISFMPLTPHVHAADENLIDLTSFASGDASTHSHVWIDTYDANYHWQYCQLCNIERNKTAHTLTTTYTISSTSCSSSNRKLTSCSGCKYVNNVAANIPHSTTSTTHVSNISWNASQEYSYVSLYNNCPVCGRNTTIAGPYNADGSLINWKTAVYPVKIYDKDGTYLTTLSRKTSNYPKTLPCTYTWNYDGDKYTDSISVNLSEVMSYLASQGISENMLNTRNIRYGIYNFDNRYLGTWPMAQNPSFNSSTKVLTTSSTFDYRNYNEDFTAPMTISGGVLIIYNLNGISNELWVPLNFSASIYTNIVLPTITSTTYTAGTTYGGFTNSLTVKASGKIVGSFTGYATLTDKATGNVLYPTTVFTVNSDDTYNINLPLTGITYNGGTAILKIEDYSKTKVTTKEITLPAVDTQPPVITNISSLNLHSTWDDKKTMTLNFSEPGVGGTQISINNENNYKTVTNNTITYTLTGNVYSQKNICLFVKDAVGNFKTYLVPVNKLDYTAPSITTAKFVETANTQPYIQAAATDASGSTLSYRLKKSNGTVVSNWSSKTSYTSIEDGSYIIDVMDQAGNITSSSAISVDLIDYTVTFKDYDGRNISSKTYNYGQAVSIPNSPIRTADKTYTYQFKDWGTQIETSVTKDSTYTAVYTSTYINYKVEFLNYNGSTLQSKDNYHWGDPVIPPPTPSKPEDDTYTYVFAGWDKEVTNVAGNTTYTAKYTPIYKEYNIVFKDWNGDILSEKDDYHWGDSVELPETPTKDTTVSTIYTFSHYNPTVTTVQGDMEYTAVYSETVNSHTVTFKNYDGSIISSETYDYGEEIVIPDDPSKPADETYTYEFTDWSPRVEEICNSGAEYIAQYEPIYIDYTVRFENWDGELISEELYHYGDSVETPSINPTKDPDETYTYEFAGWDEEVIDVTESVTYVAVFTPIFIDYTITFLNWNGDVISEEIYHWNNEVLEPTGMFRPSDNFNDYTFDSWDKEVVRVNGSTTYVAVYKPDAIEYVIEFLNWDGTPISSKIYHYEDPVIIPPNPEKPADEAYTYRFIGWDKEVSNLVQGNMQYIAQYESIFINYTITFEDYDGTSLDVKTDYHYGDIISLPSNPTRETEDGIEYYFSNWGVEFPQTVTGDMTFRAVYTLVSIDYTITFLDWNENVISSETYHYHDSIAFPHVPSRPNDETYSYKFIGWSPWVSEIAQTSAVYIAQYESKYIDYTITFKDYDGRVIDQKTNYHYGDSIIIPAAPRRPSKNGIAYQFSGWAEGYPKTVTDNMIFTAQYKEVKDDNADNSDNADNTSGHKITNKSPAQISDNRGKEGEKIIITLSKNQIEEGRIPIIKDIYNNEIPLIDLGNGKYSFIMPDTPVIIEDYVEKQKDFGEVIAPSKVTGGEYSIKTENGITTIDASPKPGYILESISVTNENDQNISLNQVDEHTYSFITPEEKTYVNLRYCIYCQKIDDCPIHPYEDAIPSEWYHDGLHYCIKNDLMVGINYNEFSPTTDTTRAQIIQILYRIDGNPVVNTKSNYIDVIDSWYSDAVDWASSVGIVSGYGNNKFGPNDPVTREQLATIIDRYMSYRGYQNVVDLNINISDFQDSYQISDYAKSAMENALDNDLLNGLNADTIDPKGKATRAQIASILQRFCENIVNL